MDWFTWLSKTSLDPSLVYEYGLAFAHNELEEDDITYFNHDFLQSMGISIAKHRLEILKVAKREKSHSLNLKYPISKLVLALKKTKKSLANYIARLSHKGDDRAIIVFPNKKKKKARGGALSYSSRWRKSMMINNNNINVNNKRSLVMMHGDKCNTNQEQLMITNGDYFGDDPMILSTPKLGGFSSPMIMQHHYHDHQINDGKTIDDDDHGDEYWTPVVEDIRWDAMFQDLKPT